MLKESHRKSSEGGVAMKLKTATQNQNQKKKSPQPASLPLILKCTETKNKASHNSPSIFHTHTKPGCLVAGLRACTHLGNFIQQFVVFLSFLKSAQIAAHSKKQKERANLLISPGLRGN